MINLFLPIVTDNDLHFISIFNQFLQTEFNKTYFCNQEKIHIIIYGTFPKAIWNGGRTLDNEIPYYTEKQIQDRIEFINNQNMSWHITFTNSLLKNEHLSNEYCNIILKCLDNNNNNGVILSSDILKNYIEINYPNLKLISSITKGNDLITFQNNIEQNYDYVVAYAKKQIIDYIATLPKEQINKAEILINNNYCSQCPKIKEHADWDSKNNLNGFNNFIGTHILYSCYTQSKEFSQLSKNISDNNRIVSINYCLEKGIKNFKIQGRGDPVKFSLDNYVTQIFLPEYQEWAIEKLTFLYNSTPKLI